MIGGEQVIFFNETKEERYENICVEGSENFARHLHKICFPTIKGNLFYSLILFEHDI